MQEKVLREQPEISPTFVQKDLLKDWLPGLIGRFKTNLWNQAQMQGNVSFLNWMGSRQRCIDALLSLPVFWGLFSFLKTRHPERVIDTQPLATKALIAAIRLYNRLYRKNLVLEKVMTDPPSAKAVHFLPRIKRLSKKDRYLLRLITTDPILEPQETSVEFWEKHTKLSMKHITTLPFLVREGFLPYIEKKREMDEDVLISFSYKTPQERNRLEILADTDPRLQLQKNTFSLFVEKNAVLITILLGFRAPKKSLLSYVQALIDVGCVHKYRRIYAIVCCGENRALQTEIWEKYSRKKGINTTILPVSNQQSSTIGALFHRSDIICTKSGGQTTMELFAVATTGQICIHTEHKEGLIKGIPCWEAANADYLRRKKGASIVNPPVFHDYLHDFFSE